MDAHSFYIPVMGIGFTIDTSLRVAKYGISSVLSLVDDTFVEQMRRYHCQQRGEPYEEIGSGDEDHRARRITAYLDLLDRLVAQDFEAMRRSPFEPGSDIDRYFRLLPDGDLRAEHRRILDIDDPDARKAAQEVLRDKTVCGRIDVNIMTKLDRDRYVNGEKLPAEYADAMAALRGFANSTVRSSVVLSAGLNPRLYSYIASFDGFFPDDDGNLHKKIILKVSDYRSAEVQGKFLAKKGLWVSEFRVESGLNCGGHAFPSKGYLMGPILEEFRTRKKELTGSLADIYRKALGDRAGSVTDATLRTRITVQGGIGTAEEDRFLHRYYEVDGTGWGTPFLLVPEATNVDERHLEKLAAANTEKDVYLSAASPMGIPFWTLSSAASEDQRRDRIEKGVPGSPCPKGHGATYNVEFSEIPECTATRKYIRRKLVELEQQELTPEQREILTSDVLAKACICHELSGGATLMLNIDPKAQPAVCCGPNIMHFAKVLTLEEMVDHIYGRINLLINGSRPHIFIKELSLYVDYLKKEMEKFAIELQTAGPKYFAEFRENLQKGIEYYRGLAEEFVGDKKKKFLEELKVQSEKLDELFASYKTKLAETG